MSKDKTGRERNTDWRQSTLIRENLQVAVRKVGLTIKLIASISGPGVECFAPLGKLGLAVLVLATVSLARTVARAKTAKGANSNFQLAQSTMNIQRVGSQSLHC